VTGEDEPLHILESSLSLTQSMGLSRDLSCSWLDRSEAAPRCAREDRFFDLSALELPAEEPDSVRKVLSLLRPLRALRITGSRQNQLSGRDFASVAGLSALGLRRVTRHQLPFVAHLDEVSVLITVRARCSL